MDPRVPPKWVIMNTGASEITVDIDSAFTVYRELTPFENKVFDSDEQKIIVKNIKTLFNVFKIKNLRVKALNYSNGLQINQ